MFMNVIISPNEMLDSFILLQIARNGQLHGYAISAMLEETLGWKPSLTTIYNILKKMASGGLVVSEERIENGRVQKVYSITEKGQNILEEWRYKMRKEMKKNFSYFFSLMQNVDSLEEIEHEELKEKVNKAFSLLRRLTLLVMLVSRTLPDDVFNILNKTVNEIEDLAKSHNINTNFESTKK